ncbi:hypothetical protein N8I74_07645 [Chitiniphilus purpureus]|uniref:Uncharacterized protein n=1 Tax=Chitiniphilus purpureus TaxID=2981137 RepID=A0ABY6DRM8_9NEIS|nr:hypothetical protein [Chitiniphilus sp. CD1]UXY16878.1 hypothetical protein N8I74_07645 [Chitiniphilus sp. CD1]
MGGKLGKSEWSLWRALEDWRRKRHELEPLFAAAGLANEQETLVNRALVDLKRTPPTMPLVSGDPQHDEEELARYREAYYRHFDESLYKVDTLLQLPWVPEMAPLAEAIRAEVNQLREWMHAHPAQRPDFSRLEQLLQHYLRLDHPELPLPQGLLEGRRRLLMDVVGYPLLVQHAGKDPFNDAVPPLSSSAFRHEFHAKAQQYLETPWLHSKVVTHWYAMLGLDAALARKKRDATDQRRLAAQLPRRWPSLSVLLPGFEQADQLWYLSLSGLAFFALFAEWWIAAGLLIIWLSLSIGAHRREQQQIEARRAQLVAQAATMKRVRDRFMLGSISPDKLSFQLRQLDERNEYHDEILHVLLKLHAYDQDS